jgi:hypothetical protein
MDVAPEADQRLSTGDPRIAYDGGMGASTSLLTTQLSVAPGSEVRAQLRVRNTGNVVDQFTLDVLGDAKAFASVQPPQISLFPGAEQTVDVVFHPAKVSSITAGVKPFAVRALSSEDPQGSSVEEGTVEVFRFDDRAAELLPRTSKGKRSATHDLAFDNRGNAPVNVRFSGLDPENQLGFEFTPPGAVAEPGTAQFVKVRVRPAKSFWRGTPKTYPFIVSVDEDGQPPTVVDGTMVQEAKLPKWFWKAVLAAIAFAVLLTILWLTLVKPQIKSAVSDRVAPIDSRLDAASIPTLPPATKPGAPPPTTKPAGVTTAPPIGGATTTTTGGGVATTAGGGTTVTTAVGETVLGLPFDTRLAVQSSAGTDATFVVPAGKTLSLTDILLQNPQGDAGTLTLKRNDTVLFVVVLENFRTQDLHYISPYVFKAGDKVTVTIGCTAAGPPAGQCVDAASLGGFIK